MRFTLEDVGDVEVPDRSTLAVCRPGLAALTGLGALAAAPLHVDGYRLEDSHVAGAEPWVPGSVLRVGAPAGPGRPDPARLALDAPWHLAVVAGPDAGLVAVPDADGLVRVGRSGTPAGGAGAPGVGRLVLADLAVSARHAVVRATRRGWRVQDAGSANGTRIASARRTRRTGKRGRRITTGHEVRLGATVLVVRRPAHAGRTARPRDGAERPAVPRPSPASWLVPLLVALALAILLRSVVPALLGLTSLVPLLGSLRRSERPAEGEDRSGVPDPAASAVRAVDLGAPGVVRKVGMGAPGAAGTGSDDASWWRLLQEGVALTGPRPQALAAARTVVGAAVAEPDVLVRFVLGAVPPEDWSWCRWVHGRRDAPRSLLVADGADRSVLHRWSLDRPPGAGVLLIEPDPLAVPAWCAWTVDATGGWHRHGGVLAARPAAPAARPGQAPAAPRGTAPGAARVTVPRASRGTAPGASAGNLPRAVRGASPAWAEAQGRRAAARDHRLARGGARLPDRVGLTDLGALRAEDVAARWSAQRGAMRSLTAGIAVDPTGPVGIDLLADGPHALVAGTTGAGKSALLQALVLDLALRHPPERLVVVLVDFKGGAGLGPCRRLPHVVGEVTDLDAALAARALDGLRTELRRREELLRVAGLADLEQLRARGPAPPRILVVVDELRALRDDLPDVLPALVRLAAQGRSLGIHLVLATQRPAGALDAQVRANVALRICLRVTDPAESTDVVDVPDAAELPADRPGRAVLRRGHAEPVLVQTAWAGLAPTAAVVRWATPWPSSGGARRDHDAAPDADADADADDGADDGADADATVRRLVETARGASDGLPEPTALWSPPLPAWVTDAELEGEPAPAVLRVGLADRPDLRAHPTVGWDPSSGALVVVGRPGSGRTTALQAVARSALREGRAVHLVRGRPCKDEPEHWGDPRHDGWGTVVDVRDPLRLVRLLHRLREGAEPDRLLLVDDAAGVLRLLDAPRHGGAELLVDLVRDAARVALGVAVAGGPADLLRLIPHAGTRLVLATGDATDEAALGVPRGLPARRAPGRGVLLPSGHLVQVSAGPGRSTVPARRDRDRPAPLRLAPLPLDVTLPAELGPPHAGLVLGRGGDEAAVLSVPLRPGLLVIGPPCSGRSTALATAALATAARPGHELLDLGALQQRPGWAAGDLAVRLREWGAAPARSAGPRVLLADDLDRVLRTHPEVDEVLADWLERAEAGEQVPVVLASARTDRAATAFRGALPALRQTAAVLVLWPLTPGSTEAVGSSLTAATDPAQPRRPGRGVLVHAGSTVPIQVARAEPDR